MHLRFQAPSRRGLSLAAALALGAGFCLPASALPVIGLTTTNALVTFDSASPTNGSTLSTITGLQSANERILGIDTRTSTGVLYGVSSDSKVYSLTMGGAATYVATLATPLNGSAIGVDFNPVADNTAMTSLRIVSSGGQNLAFNVDTGATANTAGMIPTGLTSVAYSNNDRDAGTSTALYYIDSGSNELKIAPTAFNSPTITTVGSLGMDVTGVSGFDIYSASTGYAAFTDADTGKSALYSIDLATGAATFAGAFGIGGSTAIAPPLLGLTIAAVVPEPQTYALMIAGLAAVGFVARRRRRG
ncbi:DUF4394 domain-containing protein [Aquincola sp. MAHUQ-54]|uniref:DUF4394 domain-containing protein n=1 Tax=Aquincola agrisoli TaxID=3119538 RepID=A0AAW9QB13_9BURK